MTRTGPHFNLEMLSKAELALPPMDVNNATEPAGATVGTLGYSLQGFQGDLVVLIQLGALANDVTVALEDAAQDGVGDPPEAVDFAQVVDSDAANISATILGTADDTLVMWRVSKDLLRDYARIQVTNGSVSSCIVGVAFLEMLPEYEDQLSHRSAGTYTEFK